MREGLSCTLRQLNHKNSTFRKLAYAGARYGPKPWVRYSPAFFGAAFACALPRQRAVVRRNLRRLCGPRPLVAEELDVFRTFIRYAHCLAESLALERPEAQAAVPSVQGGAHLDAALRSGHGAVLVTAHTGAWDATARWLARDRVVPVSIVMAAEEDERARALHDGVRERSGVRIVHIGSDPVKALGLLRQLRAGGIVAIQLDRSASGASLDVMLGGAPFSVPEGPFVLASLTGAPIVPVFARRVGYFRYELEVRPAIAVPPHADRAALFQAATAAAAEMEAFLRQNATEWFHFSE